METLHLDGNAHNLDILQVARSYAVVFCKQKGAVTGLERSSAALGHGIEAHHSGAHRVRCNRVRTNDKQPGFYAVNLALAAAERSMDPHL